MKIQNKCLRSLALLALAAAACPVAAAHPAAKETPAVMLFPRDHQTDEKRAFQGIPGLDMAPNGRLWATWYGAGQWEDQDNIVMLATSGDDGNTWSDLKIVIDMPRPIRCFDPVVWLDPQKRLWLFWAQANSGSNAHTWALRTANPQDEDPVWEKPFIVAPGVMMNKPTVLKSGDWLLPVSDWEGRLSNAPGAATAGTLISRNQGQTFEALGAVLVPPNYRQFDEHMFVEKSNGVLLMWVRTKFGIGESVSKDGGETWTELQRTEVPHPVTRFFIRRLKSGNLLLVRHVPNPQDVGERSKLTAFVSKDDGVTWEGGLLLDARPGVSYPDGIEGADGIIRIIYDYDRLRAKQIFMAAFAEADVLAGDSSRPGVRLRVLINQATGELDGTGPVKPPALADFSENEDGEALLRGVPARWELPADSVAPFQEQTLLFSDRDYLLSELPEELKGSRFFRGLLERTEAVCTADGIAYVTTPTLGRNPDSLHADLLKMGFKKAALREFQLFDRQPSSAQRVSLYQKEFKAGDRLEFGKWGILIMPPAAGRE